MSRTSMGIVAGLLVLGCVVAILPAQESSRRTASKYRPNAPGTGTERPSLAPFNSSESDLPPVVQPPGLLPNSPPRSSYFPAGQQPEPGVGTATSTVPRDPLGTAPVQASAAQPAASADGELDDSGLRSVLKRPSTTAAPATETFIPTSEEKPSSTPAAVSNFSLELSRRGGNTSIAPPAPHAPPSPSATTSSLSSATAPRASQNTSAASKSAALKVEIAGPHGVTVGKPAVYVLTVNNESDTAAEEVHLRVPLPSWVTVQSTQPTSGEASVQGDAQGAARLNWLVPRVAARSREQLKLQLVTREGDSFELAAEWTVKPTVAKAAIIVKQPRLALSLAGPADMVFGDEKTFTLTVSNPGTGDAERVLVSVVAANAPPQQFDAGVIPAGHKKDVPLAVVASQAGAIELQVSAAAEGGLEARTAGKIIVRKAEVNVAIDGPPMKYAGSEASYVVTVANSGTAAADNVKLSLALPAGAKYLGGIDGANASATGVKWKIASLAAGTERQYEVRLQLTAPGTNRVTVESQAAASGVANCAASTEVEAVSDLKLVVHDPSGPLPTEELTTYELQVLNRGTQAARQVKILVQFSDGIEPVSFEGCDARIVPGQVVCQPLPQLGPGEQATVRVKAKAHNPGAHHFRVEVTSTEGDARLVSEGTTRFFTDSGRGGAAANTARKPSLLPNTSIPTTIR